MTTILSSALSVLFSSIVVTVGIILPAAFVVLTAVKTLCL